MVNSKITHVEVYFCNITKRWSLAVKDVVGRVVANPTGALLQMYGDFKCALMYGHYTCHRLGIGRLTRRTKAGKVIEVRPKGSVIVQELHAARALHLPN